MTAEYISKKCGMVTIGVTNNQMPVAPLFSPILNTTKPYSQTRSSTQRALMLPDEVLRMSNEQVLVLLRGQKPLLLYKIIPDELPSFEKLTPVRIVDYVPEWKRMEDERKLRPPKSIPSKDSPSMDKQDTFYETDTPERERKLSERKPRYSPKYSILSEPAEEENITPPELIESSGPSTLIAPFDSSFDNTTDGAEDADDEMQGLYPLEEALPHQIIG